MWCCEVLRCVVDGIVNNSSTSTTDDEKMIYRLRESDTHKTITPELQKKVCAILLANMQQEQEEHERSKSD